MFSWAICEKQCLKSTTIDFLSINESGYKLLLHFIWKPVHSDDLIINHLHDIYLHITVLTKWWKPAVQLWQRCLGSLDAGPSTTDFIRWEDRIHISMSRDGEQPRWRTDVRQINRTQSFVTLSRELWCWRRRMDIRCCIILRMMLSLSFCPCPAIDQHFIRSCDCVQSLHWF